MPDLFGGPDVSLAAQIAEVRRELAQRERVYPRLVATGTLSKARAELQTAALQAVLETLFQLEKSRSGDAS